MDNPKLERATILFVAAFALSAYFFTGFYKVMDARHLVIILNGVTVGMLVTLGFAYFPFFRKTLMMRTTYYRVEMFALSIMLAWLALGTLALANPGRAFYIVGYTRILEIMAGLLQLHSSRAYADYQSPWPMRVGLVIAGACAVTVTMLQE